MVNITAGVTQLLTLLAIPHKEEPKVGHTLHRIHSYHQVTLFKKNWLLKLRAYIKIQKSEWFSTLSVGIPMGKKISTKLLSIILFNC